MTSHIPELLDLAISTTKSRESSRAFSILVTPNQDIMAKLVQADMTEFADKLFTDAPVMGSLARFIMILTAIAPACPEAVLGRAELTKRIYNYLEFDPVYHMIEGFFKQENCKNVVNYLALNSFVPEIFEREGMNDAFIESAYRLIPFMVKHEEIADQIKTPEFINRIFTLTNGADDHKLLALCDALLALTCGATSTVMLDHLETLMAFVKRDETGRFHVHQTVVMDILLELMQFDVEKVSAALIEHKFGTFCAALVKECTRHSNLQNRIRKLLFASLKIDNLRTEMAIVLPIYRELFMEKKWYWMHGYKTLKKLQKMFTDTDLKDKINESMKWDEELNTELQKIAEVKKAPYGGELPSPSLTPQQMMMLMRLLQQRQSNK